MEQITSYQELLFQVEDYKYVNYIGKYDRSLDQKQFTI